MTLFRETWTIPWKLNGQLGHVQSSTLKTLSNQNDFVLTSTRSELQQGLDDMNAFELGYTMSFASLQSVVWRIFCKKANCSLQDSWTPAKKMIESEMAAYEIEDWNGKLGMAEESSMVTWRRQQWSRERLDEYRQLLTLLWVSRCWNMIHAWKQTSYREVAAPKDGYSSQTPPKKVLPFDELFLISQLKLPTWYNGRVK